MILPNFDRIDKKLEEHDKKFDKIDKKLGEIEEKQEKHDRRFDKLDERLDRHSAVFEKHEKEIISLKLAHLYPSYSGLQPDRAKKLIRWVYTQTNRSFLSIN